MKVLVTGANGRIGRHVVPHLLECGHDVTFSGRPNADRPSPGVALDLAAVPTDLDLSDFRAVLHLAGIGNRRSASDNYGYEAINHRGTAALARVAARSGVERFVLASTVLVHGDQSVEPLTTTSPLNPTDAYARSKLAAESALHDPGLGEMQRWILRIGQFVPTGSVAPVVEQLVAKLPLVPVPCPDNRRATASEVAVNAAVDEALVASADSVRPSIRLVGDGHRGFAEQARVAASRTLLVPVPRTLLAAGCRLVTRCGGPRMSGVYADLPIAN